MTTLVDEIARAIEAETEQQRLPGERPMMLSPLARAALQTVARYLREPSEEMMAKLRTANAAAYRVQGDGIKAELSALASHLEKEMG